MVYYSISDFIIALQNYKNTRWKITPYGNFANINGGWITEAEYKAHNTKPRYVQPPKPNPDTKNIPH